jgi:hypothetical protein
MATIVLNPLSDISIGLNTVVPAGAHCAQLGSADDDSSYVGSHWGSGTPFDIYGLPLFALGTINSISVTMRCKVSMVPCYCQTVLSTNGGDIWGTQRSPTSWTTYTDTWYTNPITGVAWTVNDIAGMVLKLGIYTNSSWNGYCTQLYVTIDYTPYGASSETLSIVGAGSYTQISWQTPDSGSHYDKVDDPANYPDEDSTYLETRSESYQLDTYDLSDLGAGVLRINAVVVFYRLRSAGSGICYGKAAVYTNSGVAYGTERSTSNPTSYVTFAHVWTANPITGVAWTKAEINALQAGAAIHTNYPAYGAIMTQVAVVVCYTVDQAPATPSTPSGIASGAPTISYTFSAAATDPEGDNIYYVFDWGDGNQSTTGYYASGAAGSASHSWSSPGTYLVKVYAVDSYGVASGWSSTTTVVIASPGSYAKIVGLW